MAKIPGLILGFNICIPNEKEVLYFLVICLLNLVDIESYSALVAMLFLFYRLINDAANCPEIMDGGMPGPGTVS